MNEHTPLPTSIRKRLELAESLMKNDRPQEARDVFAQACVELARTAPELCAGLMAGVMGRSSLYMKRTETTETLERIEYRAFGLLLHEEWKPIRTTRRVEIEAGMK